MFHLESMGEEKKRKVLTCAQIRAAFEKLAFPANISSWTKYDLLYKMQLTPESCCFQYAMREDAAWLKDSGYTCKEQVELQKYQERWVPEHDWENRTKARQDEFPDPNGTLLSSAMRTARDLRNDATHRSPLPFDHIIVGHVHDAMKLAIMLGDRISAVEIEIIAERFLTKASRQEVLESLRSTYLNHGCQMLDQRRETRRQEAITTILKQEGLEMKPAVANDDFASNFGTQLGKALEDMEGD